MGYGADAIADAPDSKISFCTFVTAFSASVPPSPSNLLVFPAPSENSRVRVQQRGASEPLSSVCNERRRVRLDLSLARRVSGESVPDSALHDREHLRDGSTVIAAV